MARQEIRIENTNIALTVVIDGRVGQIGLFDKGQRISFADGEYSYSMDVIHDGVTHRARALAYESHEERTGKGGCRELEIRGRLDFGAAAPVDIAVRHLFTLHPREASFDETIEISNRGSRPCGISDYAFGFRKTIYHRVEEKWADGFADRVLVPVPHRRRFGHRVDRKMTEYRLPDLLPSMWETENDMGGAEGHNLPDHGAEGWVWTDGRRGLLVMKYAPETIEFSVAKGEIQPPDFCLRFGGASPWRGDPECASELAAGASIAFGVSHVELVDGGWKQGYYAFRRFLSSHGKRFPETFDPPVHWNELYDLSWALGDGSTRYTLRQLYREAEIAADIGCQALYLDPGWDTVEGSTVWDEKRLGMSLKDFVRVIRERYGLAVCLHLMTNTNSKTEYPGMYRKDAAGNLMTIWNGAKICTQSQWKAEKTRRLLKLAEAGVSFFMFDFQRYAAPCCDPSHGHEVPLRRQSHADGINEVIRNVKREYPGLSIEAHDRVTSGMQDYHPLYFQYDPPHSFDTNWGFEYMWDSYVDLISGAAVSLYEYNLAYEVPLYLHINIGQKSGLLDNGNSVGPDNSRMLAFWWYASTIRHLGIGGVSDPDSALYKALKAAMKTYMALQDYYKRGTFYGMDEMAHAHALPGRNRAVLNFFNISGAPVRRRISISPEDVGVDSIDAITGVGGFRKEGRGASFDVELGPFSPSLATLNF